MVIYEVGETFWQRFQYTIILKELISMLELSNLHFGECPVLARLCSVADGLPPITRHGCRLRLLLYSAYCTDMVG